MTSSITSAASYLGQAQSSKSQNKLADDLNTFLNLLTTQLKHQDPLSPMDSTEFTNQLVQFSAVEQNIYTNENLENLIGLQTTSMAASAINYIGNTIQANTQHVPLQDGAGKFTYNLSENAATTSIVLKDRSGAFIRSFDGETTSGLHTVEWDGKDKYGVPVEDGAYEVVVTSIGKDEEGPVDVEITSFGRVTGVGNDENGVYMGMGDVVVTMDDVLTVRENTKPAIEQTTQQDDAAA